MSTTLRRLDCDIKVGFGSITEMLREHRTMVYVIQE